MNKHFATIVVVLNGILIFCFLGLRGWLPPAPEKIEEVFEHHKISAGYCRDCTTAINLSPGAAECDRRADDNAQNIKFIITNLNGINKSEKLFEFETPLLRFRELTLADSNDMHPYLSNPKMAARMQWKPNQSKFDTKLMINTLLSKNEIPYYSAFVPWAVVDKETNTVIATAEISEYSHFEPQSTINYLLNSDYWGSEHELEIIRALIEVGFVVLNCVRVSGKAESELRYLSTLFASAGMSPEGIEPDYRYINNQPVSYEVFSVLRKEIDQKLINKSALNKITMIEVPAEKN
jgi:RimJ/RimL family protein N-acetyltransferase